VSSRWARPKLLTRQIPTLCFSAVSGSHKGKIMMHNPALLYISANAPAHFSHADATSHSTVLHQPERKVICTYQPRNDTRCNITYHHLLFKFGTLFISVICNKVHYSILVQLRRSAPSIPSSLAVYYRVILLPFYLKHPHMRRRKLQTTRYHGHGRP
jgi:hypothetical protein